MPAFIYVGRYRGSPPPLPSDTNNSDVSIVVPPWPVSGGYRACDTEVGVRNNGTSPINCYVRITWQTNYSTGYVLTQCWHNGVMAMTPPAPVPQGGPVVYFRAIGDVPGTTVPLVGLVYVNNQFLYYQYYPENNPTCGVKIV